MFSYCRGFESLKLENKKERQYQKILSLFWYTFSLSTKKSRWDFDCEESLSKKASVAQPDWYKDSLQRKNEAQHKSYASFYGTPSGTRTLDTLIKSQVLYQLS